MKPWEQVNDVHKADAIRAFALGMSPRAVAKKIGRTPQQLYDWMRDDPAFASALRALGADMDDEVMAFRERVRRASGEMLDQLMELATDAKVEAQHRNVAVRTFFQDVYGPAFTPRTATPLAPIVFISADQAAILFQAPGGQSPGGGNAKGNQATVQVVGGTAAEGPKTDANADGRLAPVGESLGRG